MVSGPGRPLDLDTCAFMEPRLARDLSGVRIHDDAAAAAAARAVAAQAFALGRHIVFGAGQYRPDTVAGRHLLAHELAHVMSPAATVDGRPVIQRQPAPEAPADFAVFVTTHRADDVAFARRLAHEDAAQLRKTGRLVLEDRQIIDAKLRYFTGAAKDAYVRGIKPALVEVTREEIQMTGTYVGRGDPPEDVLGAILAITEGALAPDRSGAPNADNVFHPAHYANRTVREKDHVDLLWEWYRIAHEWEAAPTARNPHLMIGVTGDVAKVRIAQAVAATAPLVASVSGMVGAEKLVRYQIYQAPNVRTLGQGATGATLIERYQGMVEWLNRRAEREAEADRTAAAEADQRAEVYRMSRVDIYEHWKERKSAFVSVASAAGNRLNMDQLFEIWRLNWGDRMEAGKRAVREIEHAEAAADVEAYARKMNRFYEDHELDAFGPEYRHAVSEAATGKLMLVWSPEIKVMAFDGKAHTLPEIDRIALVVARNFQDIADASSAIAAYYPRGASIPPDRFTLEGPYVPPEPAPPAPEPAPPPDPASTSGGDPAIPYRPGRPLDDTQPSWAFDKTEPGVPPPKPEQPPPPPSGGGGGGGRGPNDTIVAHPPPPPRPAPRPAAAPHAEPATVEWDLSGRPLPAGNRPAGATGGPDRVFVTPGQGGRPGTVHVVRGGRETSFAETNRTLAEQVKRGYLAETPGGVRLSIEELKGKRVLDLAAGTQGQTVRDLRAQKIDAYGMDIALSEEAAKTGYLGRSDLATGIPIKGDFDVEFELYGGLSYGLGPNTAAAFRNAVSRLRPGGTLYLGPLDKSAQQTLRPLVQGIVEQGGKLVEATYHGEDQVWRITMPTQPVKTTSAH